MRLYLTTLNCGKIPLGKGNIDTVKHLLSASHDESTEPYDMYVFGFQEYVSLGQLSKSAVFQKNLLDLSQEIVEYLNSNITTQNSETYGVVKYNYNGGLCVLVIGKESLVENTQCQLLNSRCGMLRSGLKGASLIRIHNTRDNWTINFISAHLAANEGFYGKRVEDMKHIFDEFNEKLTKQNHDSGNSAISLKDEQVIFFGDLNFRNSSVDLLDFNKAGSYTTQGGIEKDELHRYLASTQANFLQLKEFPIEFKPTYKYLTGANLPNNQFNNYNLKRIPSWCDRILLSSPLFDSCEAHTYQSVTRDTPFLRTTDHQSVTLSLTYTPITKDSFLSLNFLYPDNYLIDKGARAVFTVYENKGKVIVVFLVLLLAYYII